MKSVDFFKKSANNITEMYSMLETKKIMSKEFHYKNKKADTILRTDKVKLWAEIEFGVLSKDCENFGICKIYQNTISKPEQEKKTKKCKCNRTLAKLVYTKKENFKIYFPKGIISNKVEQKYFQNEFFIMEENFRMPESIVKKINCKPFILKAGRYLISENESYYVIKFNKINNIKNREP